MRVLWGACESLLTPHPLGPVLDIAEACGGELEELVSSGARPYEVAAGLVRELRERGPTILVLDDVHWADEATLDVLRLLGRRATETGALVLASFRDDELDRAVQLRLVVGDLGGLASRLKIAPLSAVAVAELSATQGSTRASCIARPPAIRSSSPRFSAVRERRFPTRSATRCWHGPRAARGKQDCCWRRSQSRGRSRCGCLKRSPARWSTGG